MHALSARPLKKSGGRDSSTCADGTIKINPISLCSHPDAHLNLNREVHRSLTWHSSKSESALERFEPVAADKLRLDGSLAMFAPEGDGCLKRTWREEAGRIHKAGTILCDFWYFSSLKSTIKEKFLHISSRVVEGTDPRLGDANTHASHMCQFPYKIKPKYSQQTKQKIKVHSAFSFDEEGAKEKATKKKTPKEDFALCGVLTQSRRRRHTRSAYVSIPTAVGGRHRLFQKAGENFILAQQK